VRKFSRLIIFGNIVLKIENIYKSVCNTER